MVLCFCFTLFIGEMKSCCHFRNSKHLQNVQSFRYVIFHKTLLVFLKKYSEEIDEMQQNNLSDGEKMIVCIQNLLIK